MSKAANNTPRLTLQQQLAELDTLLAWFDRPDIDLDQALQKFDDGVALAQKIKGRLSLIDNKIIVLKQRFDQDAP